MARLRFTDDAKDDIRGLDRSVQVRILKDLEKLKDSPADRGQPLRSHRATGNLSGLRKLRVGPKRSYRAVYLADRDELAVVMVVAERSDAQCYALARTRLDLLPDAPGVAGLREFLREMLGE